MTTKLIRAILEPVFAGVLAVAVLAGLLAISGYPVSESLSALWRGAFGSWSVLASGTLVRATPLLFAGLAVAIAFRAGILNIGAEGQLLMGAASATAAAVALPASAGLAGLALALLAGAIAGGFWASIAAVLRLRFGVLEVISTIMLNVIALNVTGLLVRGPLQEPTQTFPQSALIDDALRLPRLAAGSRLHAGVVLAVAVALGMAWFLKATASGFRLRMTGANLLAASSAGRIDVARVTFAAFVASGALAGLGGAVEVTGVTYALYENLSPGYGFTAIAVALLARLDPAKAIGSAFIFGALESGASAMQRDAQVPAGMVGVVEASVILVLVASEWIGGQARRGGTLIRGGGPASEPRDLDQLRHMTDHAATDFLGASVRNATPLLLAALGETVAERSGVINVGLEGAIIAGCFAGLVGGTAFGAQAGFAIAGVAGLAIACVFATVAIAFAADQIITGTAMTMLGLGLTSTLYRVMYGESGVALTAPTLAPIGIPFLRDIPVFGSPLFNQPLPTYFAAILVPAIWWWLYRTQSGLALRATGENPEAARSSGISPRRVQTLGALFGGLCGGLAGGALVLAQVGTFAEGMSAGRGFVAIAIVALGRWHPVGAAIAALVFGMASALQFLFQALELHLPYQLFLALPYALTLVALAFTTGRYRPPAALGRRLTPSS